MVRDAYLIGACVINNQSQKSWLLAAKRALSRTHEGLTWDRFAELAGVDPRAFKTYRMPEDSADFRKMPPLAEAAIKALLEPQNPSNLKIDPAEDSVNSVLIPALAALVVRQGRTSLIEGKMIAGISRLPGIPIGLTVEDRRAMAMLSRACLVNGLPDYGAEIHTLLAACTTPFSQWLRIPEVLTRGLSETVLIHAEEGIPTSEAEELAKGFGGVTASLEEQLFSKFLELLSKFPADAGNRYYTCVREFVVRHPTCESDDIRRIGNELPSSLWMLLQQHFYEPVPESWQFNGEVQICSHCGNAMKLGRAGLICRSIGCAASNSALKKEIGIPAARLLRVSRGIQQYWVEPGLDEIRLYDALIQMGLPALLYPSRDRVDLSVGEVGIDLKAYASPETLGSRFKRNIGGLAYYATKLVVIPDWIIRNVPSYIDRLQAAAGRADLRCLAVSDVIALFKRGDLRA